MKQQVQGTTGNIPHPYASREGKCTPHLELCRPKTRKKRKRTIYKTI